MSELELLVDEMHSRRTQRMLAGRRKSRQDHPRASSISDCPREVYYQITEWELRPEPDAALMNRFQRGSEVELLVKRELLQDGWDVVESQAAFEITEHVAELGKDLIICTGHTDGRIEHGELKPVLEVKSLNANVWNRIETIHDFIRMGGFWSKYPRQLLLYCYNFDEPHGMFLLDDCLGHWKLVPVVLEEHLDECERALWIAKTAAVAAVVGEPPPFCNDPRECRRCWARDKGVCFPPLDFSDQGVVVLDDPEIGVDISRVEELREGGESFNQLTKQIKERLKAGGPGRFLAGDFLVHVQVKKSAKKQATYVTWQRVAEDEGRTDDAGTKTS